MKYCTNCGTSLDDGAAIFCPECGKELHTTAVTTKKTRKKKSKSPKDSKKRGKAKKKDPKEVKADPAEEHGISDGYDGYYEDVLPPDLDRVKDGIDKELVKKIVIVGVCVFLIISLCVAMLYIL